MILSLNIEGGMSFTKREEEEANSILCSCLLGQVMTGPLTCYQAGQAQYGRRGLFQVSCSPSVLCGQGGKQTGFGPELLPGSPVSSAERQKAASSSSQWAYYLQGREEEEEGKLQILALLEWQREKRRSKASFSSISFPGRTE